MTGAMTLQTYPEAMVIVRCEDCGREGRYNRKTLAARYGREVASVGGEDR